jgi:hypothetical protein
MLAVCHVLRNRVFAGWGDWLDVISTAGSKRATLPTGKGADLRHADVRTLLNRVEEIYTRSDTGDLTGGALFYVETGQPILEWFEQAVLGRQEEHPRTAHIGPVWFFK